MKIIFIAILLFVPMAVWSAGGDKPPIPASSAGDQDAVKILMETRAQTAAIRKDEEAKISELQKKKGLSEAERAAAIKTIRKEFLDKRNAVRIRMRAERQGKLSKGKADAGERR